jgi:hypothetical protein
MNGITKMLKNIPLIALTFFWSSSCTTSQAETPNRGNVEDPSVYSVKMLDTEVVDEVQYGEVAILRRRIENTGVKPLSITRVFDLGCGCSKSVTTDKKVLNPGETARLFIQYDSRRKNIGLNAESFVVALDSKKILAISGEVRVMIVRDVVISPQSVTVGKIVRGDVPTLDNVKILSREQFDSSRISLKSSAPRVAVRWAPEKEASQSDSERMSAERAAFSITVTPGETLGKFEEFVDVTVEGLRGRNPVFRVGISGEVVEVLRVEPRSLFLGSADPATPIKKTFQVIDGMKEPLEIADIEFPKGVTGTYEVVNAEPSRKMVGVDIRIEDIDRAVGRFDIFVKVRSDKRGGAVIPVPCSYIGSTDKLRSDVLTSGK